ncbi:MAG: helix-turn-helix transcriptional regulator [Dehalococcoidia bacterium]
MRRPSHYNVPATRDRTPRQREVLALIARGQTNGQIAETLGITIDGAKFHVGEILARLDVSTREEAVAVWRAGRRPSARIGRMLGGLVAHRFLAGAAAVFAVAAAGIAVAFALNADDSDGSQATSEVTVADVVAAAQETGEVLHLQMTLGVPDAGPGKLELWYSVDLGAARAESTYDGELSDVTIIVPGRRASLWVPENLLADGPLTPDPADPLDPAFGMVTHVAFLVKSDTVTYAGEQTVGGQQAHRFDTTDVIDDDDREGEQIAGTVTRTSVYLRPADLLPVRIDFETTVPGQGSSSVRLDVDLAEFIDAASLPADLFDPDTLSARVPTTTNLLAIAANQPFATFWLGPRLDQSWHDPAGNGDDYQEVVLVRAPAAPQPWNASAVYLGYGPPSVPSLTLLDIWQGPTGTTFRKDGLPLDLIVAAGNSEPLPSGEGFVFVEYSPAAGCGTEQAQIEPACRKDGEGRWGAWLERDGTTILITSAPKFAGPAGADTNPFSSKAAITSVLDLLQPLP